MSRMTIKIEKALISFKNMIETEFERCYRHYIFEKLLKNNYAEVHFLEKFKTPVLEIY